MTLRSALESGHPVVLFDQNYPRMSSRIAPFAQEFGYRINIFAPGLLESFVWNPLDLLDQTNADLLKQNFSILQRFFEVSATPNENPFISTSATQLLLAAFSLASSSQYPDLLTVEIVLLLDQLSERIEVNNLNPSIKERFNVFSAIKRSEKTAAAIQGTAWSKLKFFSKPTLKGAFLGQSTLPSQLHTRQMLVIGLDLEAQGELAPLAATGILQSLCSHKNDRPLVICLDEIENFSQIDNLTANLPNSLGQRNVCLSLAEDESTALVVSESDWQLILTQQFNTRSQLVITDRERNLRRHELERLIPLPMKA